jgi:hypothetical protein
MLDIQHNRLTPCGTLATTAQGMPSPLHGLALLGVAWVAGAFVPLPTGQNLLSGRQSWVGSVSHNALERLAPSVASSPAKRTFSPLWLGLKEASVVPGGPCHGHEALVGERDACGVGFIADTKGPSHKILDMALAALGCMEHRGACSADQVRACALNVHARLHALLLVLSTPRLGCPHSLTHLRMT